MINDRPPGEPGKRRGMPSIKPHHTIIGVAAVAVAGALVMAGAYVGPLGKGGISTSDRAGELAVIPVDAKPVPITPGDRMDVMASAENGFTGIPRVERDPELEFAEAYIRPEREMEPLPPRRPEPAPAPRPIERAEVPPVDQPPSLPAQPRVRRYGSGPGQDCTDAPSRAAAMVCRDARLANAERTMQRALQRALDNDGFDRRRVLRDQAAWEAARERAAVDGVGAVDHMYRLRIDELERQD